MEKSPDVTAVFDCRRCGDCCRGRGGIVLRTLDEERLAVFLGIRVPDLRTRFTEFSHGKRGLVTGEDGWCVFFGSAGCAVHPAKPGVCRAWPFFRGNLVDPVSFAMAKAGCPGIREHVAFSVFSETGARYLLAEEAYALRDGNGSPAALLSEDELRRLVDGEDSA